MLALLVPVQGLAPSFDPPYHPKDGTQNPFCGGGAGAELVLDFAAAADCRGGRELHAGAAVAGPVGRLLTHGALLTHDTEQRPPDAHSVRA